MVHAASDIAQHGARSRRARRRRPVRLSAAIRSSSRDGPYAIGAAVPPGSQITRGQKPWLLTALALLDAEPWYASRKHAYAEMARQLARVMDWHSKTSRPGHAALGAAGGRSADTVGRFIAWLISAGLAGLVAPGWTPDLKPASLRDPGECNQAALYVLTVPKKSVPVPPADSLLTEFADLSRFSSQKVLAPRTRGATSGVDRPPAGLNSSGTPDRRRVPDQPQRWPLGRKPENRSEGEFAARAMQERWPILGRISARYLRSLTMRYYEHGWSPLDVLAALDHDRRGWLHGYRDPIRNLPGWIRSRLAEHDQADGRPGDAPGRAAAEQHERDLAEQGRRRADAERAAAARDPGATANRAAAILASITPPGSRQERAILTGRGPRAARLRELLVLGRAGDCANHDPPSIGSSSAELLHYRKAAPENPASEPP